METVIIAGGYGTRMKLYLGDLPKTLAPIGDRPFLALQLAWLEGASSVHFCLGHKAEEIEASLKSIRISFPFTISRESNALGVIGSISRSQLMSELHETFAVLLGDVLPRRAFKELIGYAAPYLEEGYSIMFLAPSQNLSGQKGNVALQGNSVHTYCKSASFQGDYVDIGFWVLQRHHLERFGHFTDEEAFFSALVAEKQLAGFNVGICSWEVGSLEGWTLLCQSQLNMIEGRN